MMKIRVVSCDADGAFYNDEYGNTPETLNKVFKIKQTEQRDAYHSFSSTQYINFVESPIFLPLLKKHNKPLAEEIEKHLETRLVQSNKVFLDQIKAENHHYDRVITAIGSTRQSQTLDTHNSDKNQTESFFVAIEKITTYLEAQLDPFLMADLYGDLKEGTSFTRATDPSYRGQHADTVYDHTKFTLLYAQMHKIALQYPQANIVFEFYDDRGCQSEDDILEHLKGYFTQQPSLIPSNITFSLNHYQGKEVTNVANIIGTGRVDENYKATIKKIAKESLGYFGKAITKDVLKIPKQPVHETKRTAVSSCCNAFFSCFKPHNSKGSRVLPEGDGIALVSQLESRPGL